MHPLFQKLFSIICLLRVKEKEPLTCIHWERSFGDDNSEKKIKKYARHQDGQC